MTTMNWASLKKTAEDATKPLPVEWYDVKVVKADATTASTGSPMIKVVLEVITGPYATRQLFTQFVLSESSGFALNIFFRNLAALGIDPEVVAPAGDLGSIAQAMIGRTARAEVGIRPWQGMDRNEVTNMAPPTGGHGGPAAPGVIAGPASGPMTGSSVPTPSFGAAPTVPATSTPGTTTPTTPVNVPQGNGPAAPPELPF